MERKIGEIFEYNGEWYQCIVGNGCWDCAFNKRKCSTVVDKGDPIGDCCADRRKDNKDVIFKKLEKVGEMYEKRVSDGTSSTFQRYRVYNSVILPKEPYIYCNFIDSTVEIEIKQNKEDMEEKKLNLKPFDLEAAKAGKPVCTRDGRKARIICFDRKGDTSIVALIMGDNDREEIHSYYKDGKSVRNQEYHYDLMMLPEKKDGWLNVYKRENEYISENECNVSTGIAVYKSEGEAKRNINKNEIYVNTIKITWEE